MEFYITLYLFTILYYYNYLRHELKPEELWLMKIVNSDNLYIFKCKQHILIPRKKIFLSDIYKIDNYSIYFCYLKKSFRYFNIKVSGYRLFFLK